MENVNVDDHQRRSRLSPCRHVARERACGHVGVDLLGRRADEGTENPRRGIASSRPRRPLNNSPDRAPPTPEHEGHRSLCPEIDRR